MTDYGRPTAVELVDAVRDFVQSDVRAATEGQVNFHARVAANVLGIVSRELRADSAGEPDESDLIAAIRAGDFDGRDDEMMAALRTIVYDRLSVAHPGYALASVADRLFAKIEAGDVNGVAAMWAENVSVWHTGDQSPSEKAHAIRVIEWFVSATADRQYDVLDRQYFGDGFVQQHVLSGSAHNGKPYSLRVAIVIRVGSDGLITRIDEYLDPADLAPLLKEETK
jgi:ketosteroid isomerase-like protein